MVESEPKSVKLKFVEFPEGMNLIERLLNPPRFVEADESVNTSIIFEILYNNQVLADMKEAAELIQKLQAKIPE